MKNIGIKAQNLSRIDNHIRQTNMGPVSLTTAMMFVGENERMPVPIHHHDANEEIDDIELAAADEGQDDIVLKNLELSNYSMEPVIVNYGIPQGSTNISMSLPALLLRGLEEIPPLPPRHFGLEGKVSEITRSSELKVSDETEDRIVTCLIRLSPFTLVTDGSSQFVSGSDWDEVLEGEDVSSRSAIARRWRTIHNIDLIEHTVDVGAIGRFLGTPVDVSVIPIDLVFIIKLMSDLITGKRSEATTEYVVGRCILAILQRQNYPLISPARAIAVFRDTEQKPLPGLNLVKIRVTFTKANDYSITVYGISFTSAISESLPPSHELSVTFGIRRTMSKTFVPFTSEKLCDDAMIMLNESLSLDPFLGEEKTLGMRQMNLESIRTCRTMLQAFTHFNQDYTSTITVLSGDKEGVVQVQNGTRCFITLQTFGTTVRPLCAFVGNGKIMSTRDHSEINSYVSTMNDIVGSGISLMSQFSRSYGKTEDKIVQVFSHGIFGSGVSSSNFSSLLGSTLQYVKEADKPSIFNSACIWYCIFHIHIRQSMPILSSRNEEDSFEHPSDRYIAMMIDIGCIILTGQLRKDVSASAITVALSQLSACETVIESPVSRYGLHFKPSTSIHKYSIFFETEIEQRLWSKLDSYANQNPDRSYKGLSSLLTNYPEWIKRSRDSQDEEGIWSHMNPKVMFQTRVSEISFCMVRYVVSATFVKWLRRQAAMTPGVSNPSATMSVGKIFDWLEPRVRTILTTEHRTNRNSVVAVCYCNQIRLLSIMMVLWEDRIHMCDGSEDMKSDAYKNRWGLISEITYSTAETDYGSYRNLPHYIGIVNKIANVCNFLHETDSTDLQEIFKQVQNKITTNNVAIEVFN
jgi:hypothetical protein